MFSQTPEARAMRKLRAKRRAQRFGYAIAPAQARQKLALNTSQYVIRRSVTKFTRTGCRCQYEYFRGRVDVQGLPRTIKRSVKIHGEHEAFAQCLDQVSRWLAEAYPLDMALAKVRQIAECAPVESKLQIFIERG